jgi:hypothetical protein
MPEPERDPQGRVLSFTLTAQGEHPARRLRALEALSDARDLFSDPHFLFGDTDDTTCWLLTTNGGAGRLAFGPEGWVLDDGFGRHLSTFPVSLHALDALTRAARLLHVEVSTEPVCSGCGCTDNWACEGRCTWDHPGWCSTCEDAVPSGAFPYEGTCFGCETNSSALNRDTLCRPCAGGALLDDPLF